MAFASDSDEIDYVPKAPQKSLGQETMILKSSSPTSKLKRVDLMIENRKTHVVVEEDSKEKVDSSPPSIPHISHHSLVNPAPDTPPLTPSVSTPVTVNFGKQRHNVDAVCPILKKIK